MPLKIHKSSENLFLSPNLHSVFLKLLQHFFSCDDCLLYSETDQPSLHLGLLVDLSGNFQCSDALEGMGSNPYTNGLL